MSEKEQSVSFTPQQLKDLMVEMAREIRRPQDPTPEEKAQAEQDMKMRRDTALLEKQKAENKRWHQTEGCDHAREDGTCAAVFVQGYNMIICQRCNALIYPEGQTGVPEGIYNTTLFNSLFRRAANTGVTF